MAEKMRAHSFDETPEKLQGYKEDVLQHLMAVEMHKRYLVGPRLVQELTGTAKVLVRPKTLQDPQWLSHVRGAYEPELLTFLEDALERPSLIDANNHVTAFFYNVERKKEESMTGWIARHSKKLWEASRAMQRVQREPGQNKAARQWKDWESASQRTSRSGPFRDDGRIEEDDSSAADEWYGHTRSWSGSGVEPPSTWDYTAEPFIPEFLTGFLSGMDPAEKWNVLTAIKGEFTTQAMAKALGEQWGGSDLAKRDKQKAGSALLAMFSKEDEGRGGSASYRR